MCAADPRWNPEWDLSPAFVPKGRYLSADFVRLEEERLWTQVWQVACREDEVAETGAYVEYRVGTQSILVVRTDTGKLKAFFNSCRHRGMRLAHGSGRFEGRTITCPYHGWCWKLDGRNSYVMDREEFREEHVAEERLRLVECAVATWGGFVWIHMDRDAEPLERYLAPITEVLAPFEVERTHPMFHKRAFLRANWKVALDAFIEGYHALATHPETRQVSTDNTDASYYQVERGHSYYTYSADMLGRSAERLGVDERKHFGEMIAFLVDELRGVYVERDREAATQVMDLEIPEGSSVGEEYGRLVAEHARRSETWIPQLSPKAAAHILGVHFAFPNFMVLPGVGTSLFYRSLPVGREPDACVFEIWSTQSLPEGREAPAYPQLDLDPQDREGWGLIPSQDLANMESVQAGMNSHGFEGLVLNTRQEMGVLHMHREIDRYLHD